MAPIYNGHPGREENRVQWKAPFLLLKATKIKITTKKTTTKKTTTLKITVTKKTMTKTTTTNKIHVLHLFSSSNS